MRPKAAKPAAQQERAGSRREHRLSIFRLLPGAHDAMNDGDIGTDREDPQHYVHAIRQRAQNHQHQALGAFPKSHFAGRHQRFRAGLGITDHHRAGHRRASQHGITEAIHVGEIDQQPKEKNQVGIAIENRIEKTAEHGDAALAARHGSIEKVAESGQYHHAAGGSETTSGEKNRGPEIQDQRRAGDEVGRDTGSGNQSCQAFDGPDQEPAYSARQHE